VSEALPITFRKEKLFFFEKSSNKLLSIIPLRYHCHCEPHLRRGNPGARQGHL
jgi:hypothetical protein